MLSALTLGILLFHIADDGLPIVIYMNVLDTKVLMPAATQASKNLHLHRITSRSGPSVSIYLPYC